MAQYIATAKGYFNQILNPGDVFDGPEGMKGSWLEPLHAKAAADKSQSKLIELPIAELRIMAQNKGIKFDKNTSKKDLAAALTNQENEDEDLA